MTGTIKIFTGRAERPKRVLPFYSKYQAREIYNTWRELLPDAVIHICPDVDKSFKDVDYKTKMNIYRNTQPVKKVAKEIIMEDFIEDNGLRHETYFHRCYYKGEN